PRMGMWDVNSGEQLWEIASPSGLLGFSPDGKTFLTLEGLRRATGGKPDLHFSVYSSNSGNAIRTLDLLGGPVTGLPEHEKARQCCTDYCCSRSRCFLDGFSPSLP